jgi:GNAT superfamily N-acetyltransferase
MHIRDIIQEMANNRQMFVNINKRPVAGKSNQSVSIFARLPDADKWQAFIFATSFDQEMDDGKVVPNFGVEVMDVWIDPSLRRQGVATFLYNLLEKLYGLKVVPSGYVSDDAVKFWAARGVEVPEESQIGGTYEARQEVQDPKHQPPLDQYEVFSL